MAPRNTTSIATNNTEQQKLRFIYIFFYVINNSALRIYAGLLGSNRSIFCPCPMRSSLLCYYVIMPSHLFEVVEDTEFESHFEGFFLRRSTHSCACAHENIYRYEVCIHISLVPQVVGRLGAETKRIGQRTAVDGTDAPKYRSRRSEGGECFTRIYPVCAG